MHSLRALRLLGTRQLLPNNLARATSTSTSPEQGGPQNVPYDVAPPTVEEEEKVRVPVPVRVRVRVRVPPPFAPSPKVESREVGPADKRGPSFQQKRRLSTAAAAAAAAARALEEASCVGVDGTAPLSAAGAEAAPAKEEEEEEGDDNEEYYREHEPSPVSQVEVVDTRKPINRGVVVVEEEDMGGGEWRGVMVEDTVDDALARAEAMFREAAARGDPDLPHSRALARLLRQREERFRSEPA